jgi:hypothetical protein
VFIALIRDNTVDMDTKIKDCQTIAELTALERLNTLSEAEQRLVFEKKMEIFQRIREWRIENERLGLVADLSDTWTPEQRARFLYDWQNDEPLLQVGCGQKRSYDEMNDGAIDARLAIIILL